MCRSLDLYEKASSAKVNWSKGEGFVMGPWEYGGPPKLPGVLQWGTEGIKILDAKKVIDKQTVREGWIRCQLSCLNENGYHLNYPIGVESWL